MRAMGCAGRRDRGHGPLLRGGDGFVGARHARDGVRGRRDRGHGPLLRGGDAFVGARHARDGIAVGWT